MIFPPSIPQKPFPSPPIGGTWGIIFAQNFGPFFGQNGSLGDYRGHKNIIFQETKPGAESISLGRMPPGGLASGSWTTCRSQRRERSPKQGRSSRRFFREKIPCRDDSPGRQPPADNTDRATRKRQAKSSGDSIPLPPEHMPAAEPAQMRGIMQGGGDGLQNGRAEGFYAHGIKSIPGLFTTPL